MEGRLYRFYLSWRSGTVPLSSAILPRLFRQAKLQSAGRVEGGRVGWCTCGFASYLITGTAFWLSIFY